MIEYLITRMADRFVCSSQNTVDILHDKFNVDVEHAVLVNDGADEFPLSESEALRVKLAMPENKAIVIFTGALTQAKGLAYLCETMLQAKKRQTNCHFLLIGYPENEVRDFCEEHQLQTICTPVGRIPYEHLGDYLALADIALEPKLSDSGEASGKLLNYMGAGLPVVCFDTKNNRQILGGNGYYAAPNALIDQIVAAAAEPAKAAEIGEAGRVRVRKQFSWDAAGEKIQSVYNSSLMDRI